MAMRKTENSAVVAAVPLMDDQLQRKIARLQGRWVAVSPPSKLLGDADTAAAAYELGQKAGEQKPAIWRVPMPRIRAL